MVAAEQVDISTVDTAADSIVINASLGGVDIGSSLDLDINSSAGSVNIAAAEAVADAIVVEATDVAGGVQVKAGTNGIDLDSEGFVTVTPATATVANPTTTAVINANVGVATFTGFTTAAAASETLTITNSKVSSTSAILVTVSNLGANDAQMTLQRIKQGAGTFDVEITNNGAAALNGNIVVTFWVIQ
jgi:hypothetical protein